MPQSVKYITTTSVQKQMTLDNSSNRRLLIWVSVRSTSLRFSLSTHARRIPLNDLRGIVKHEDAFYTITERGVAPVSAQNASAIPPRRGEFDYVSYMFCFVFDLQGTERFAIGAVTLSTATRVLGRDALSFTLIRIQSNRQANGGATDMH